MRKCNKKRPFSFQNGSKKYTQRFLTIVTFTFQAHTLVSPQGVCSKAIFTAAGPDIAKMFQVPPQGEILVTPGYQLACSHVIHTSCCKWDGGNGEWVRIL